MKNVLNITMVIIGAIIGAGFASGQEINSFFYKYGIIGILGMLISIFLISLIIYKVFLIIKKENINTYKNFLENIFKNKFQIKNKYLNIPNIINIIINIFLVISFFIMIAGFGAYFNQEYGINKMVGSGILAGLCLIIFTQNIEGLIKINKYLIPILIFFMIIIGTKNMDSINMLEINNEKIINNFFSPILSGIVYASYNVILLIPVLIPLKNKIEKNNILLISIFSGIILFVLSLIIYSLLLKISINIDNIELPAVYTVRKYFPKLKIFYEFIILTSILTTAVSSGLGALENITKNKKTYTQFALILCITGVIFSQIGFSNLINLLYPIFGILGFSQIFMILKYKINKN